MASAFDRMFKKNAIPRLMRENGESVVYTVVGGEPVSISAVLNLTETGMVAESDHGRFVNLQGTVTISASDLGTDVAPAAGDSILIHGKEWKVERAEGEGYGLWTLGVIRHETVDRTAPGRYSKAYLEGG